MLSRDFYINELKKWKASPDRQPLIVRGARQVGKTTLVREFSQEYKSLIEINFEEQISIKKCFEGDLSPQYLIPLLEVSLGRSIRHADTLIFLDEIQECPRALLALRYFYEKAPEINIIASGSLIEFAIEKIGIPVGRTQELYIYPISFTEYLKNKLPQAEEIILNSLIKLDPLPEVIHQKLLSMLKEYLAVGGMPQILANYLENNSVQRVQELQNRIVSNYRNDIPKYAKKSDYAILEDVFLAIPAMVGKKFKYSNVNSEVRSYKIKEGVNLLQKAGVCHQVFHSSSNGIPLGAEIKREFFKLIFLDLGLSNALMGLEVDSFLKSDPEPFINRGGLAEQFVGQEIASSQRNQRAEMFYWARESKSSSAEVDYLVVNKTNIVPVEVKAGNSLNLKSLHLFMKEKHSEFGLHVSTRNIYRKNNVIGLPLYMLGHFLEHKLHLL
jgi:uncharacterized protein